MLCSFCFLFFFFFFFSSRRRHTRFDCDWSSDVCSSDLGAAKGAERAPGEAQGRAGLRKGVAVPLRLRELRRMAWQATIQMEVHVSPRSSGPQRRYFTVAGYGPTK